MQALRSAPSRGRTRPPSLRVLLPVVGVLAVAATACGDDPFALPWEATPDTVLLYSLARPELNLPSAFNFRTLQTVVVEDATATGSWDLAVDTEDGNLVWTPPAALGINSRARIATLRELGFDEVREAPSDTAAYVGSETVPVETGVVYVVRTGLRSGCFYYAKAEAVELQPEAGTLRFRYVANPFCNNLDLVPPDTD